MADYTIDGRITAENDTASAFAAAAAEAESFDAFINNLDPEVEVKVLTRGMERNLLRAQHNVQRMEKELKKLTGTTKLTQAALEDLGDEETQRAQHLDHSIAAEKENVKHLGLVTKALRTNTKQTREEIKAQRDLVEERNRANVEMAKMRERYDQLGSALQRNQRDMRNWITRSDGTRLKGERIRSEMTAMRHSIEKAGGSVNDLGDNLEGNDRAWVRWTRSIGKARLSIGPFSGVITTMGKAMLVLGPVIMDLVGAAGALVGVVGTSLAGAFVTGGAALSGFALAGAGAFFAIKPIAHELSLATKASTAYNDAVVKYGKNSTQAQDKLDQLNNTMKGISPASRDAIKDWGKLKDMFQERTKGVRGSVFDTMAEGIRTAKALMPTFASETNKTMKVAAKGTQEWLRGLRSPEAKQILSDIMGNFRKGLPELMHGFGSLGTILGRVFGSASKSLPMLNHGFAQWANNLANSVGSGDELDQKISRLVAHMQDFGHFTQASGRFLISFFNAGANAGDDMLVTMTNALNRWTAWTKSASGQSSLQNFFQKSVHGASQLFHIIAPMASSFLDLMTAVRPVVHGFEMVTGAAASMVSALSGIPGLLEAIGAGLAAMWVGNKVGRGLGLLTDGATIASVAMGKLRGGAKAAAKETDGLTRAAVEAETGMQAAETTAVSGSTRFLGLARALGPAGLAFAAITTGALFASKALDKALKPDASARWAASMQKSSEAMHRLQTQVGTYRANLDAVKRAQNAVNDATSRFGPNATKTLQATNALGRAVLNLNVSVGQLQRNLDKSVSQAGQAASTAAQSAHDQLSTVNPAFTQYIQSLAAASGKSDQLFNVLRAGGGTVQETINAARQLGIQWNRNAPAAAGVTLALRNQNQALQQQAGAAANSIRVQRGLAPVAQKNTKEVGKFLQTFGKQPKAIKIATTGDAQTSAKIAKVSNKAAKLGGKPAVAHIIANTDNADGKLKSLEKLLARLKAKKNEVPVNVKGNLSGIKGDIAKIKSIAQAGKARVPIAGNPGPFNTTLNGLRQSASRPIEVPIIAKPQGNFHPGRFSGGVFGYAMGVDAQQRAADIAANKPDKRSAAGAQITSPRFLTGEESGATEYVITDSPQYRRSNSGYLAQAANALGYQIIPAYAGGKGHGKKKKKGYTGPSDFDYDDPTSGSDPTKMSDKERYNYWHDTIDDLASQYETWRRAYDMGIGPGGSGSPPTVQQLGSIIDNEIKAYGSLGTAIMSLLNTPEATITKLPKKSKKNKKKRDKLKEKNANAKSFNTSLKEGKEDLRDELRDNAGLVAGLTLDKYELENAAASNTILGASSSNLARYDLFKTFASNVGALTGGTGLGSSTSPPAPTPPTPDWLRLAPIGGSSGVPSTGPDMRGGGSGGIVVNNNFPTPPPDPHTWSQGITFELGALGI